MTNAPSWPAVYALLKKQKATYAKGRKRENVNDYTNWFYKTWNQAAQFCFIGISWTLAHAGATEADGLALIGGKQSYVPAIRGIKGYRAGHSGMKVGAIVAVSRFNHIGFCTAIHSNGTFELYSFNTTYNGSDDAVWPKTYSLSSASGYVNLAYGTSTTTEADDFMSEYLSVDKTAHPNALKYNTWTYATFDTNNGAVADKHHAKGNYPSFVTAKSATVEYNGAINLRITGLPKGAEGQARLYYVDMNDKPVTRCYITEFAGSTADTFVTVPAVGKAVKGHKARVEVIHYAENATPSIVEGFVRLHVK